MPKLIQRSTSRSQLLFNTIKHFNSTNRCLDEHEGVCVYRNRKGEGCAIGREIPTTLAKKFDNSENKLVSSIFDDLPKRLQKMGKLFLIDIQNLHDEKSYWTPHGLSNRGKRWVSHICKTHKVSSKIVEPYIFPY